MPFRAKQSRPWRGGLVAAVLAAATLAIGALSQPAAAQYAYDYGYGYPDQAYSYPPQPYPPQSYPAYPSRPPYGQQYNGGGNWGSGRQWQDRTWNGEDRRSGANRGDTSQGRGGDRGQTKEGRTGSSRGQGSGQNGTQGSGAGGSGDPYNSWLGSHGSYR
jgi:hypothetical protein